MHQEFQTYWDMWGRQVCAKLAGCIDFLINDKMYGLL